MVRWIDGEMSLYSTVDAKGFHGEKQLAPPKNATWKDDARLLVGGRFTAGGRRDDLLADWKDGHVSVFGDVAANGLKKQTQTVAKNNTWTYAGHLTTGSFTGKSTDDLVVRWVDGESTVCPGVTAKALPGEVKIRPAKSNWKDATVVAAGAFLGDSASALSAQSHRRRQNSRTSGGQRCLSPVRVRRLSVSRRCRGRARWAAVVLPGRGVPARGHTLAQPELSQNGRRAGHSIIL